LNERAGCGREGARPHQPEIPIVEGLKRAAQETLWFHGRNGFFWLLR
jgi:hypothetical protein